MKHKARLWKENGQWKIEITAPMWVCQEIEKDLKNGIAASIEYIEPSYSQGHMDEEDYFTLMLAPGEEIKEGWEMPHETPNPHFKIAGNTPEINDEIPF